MASDNETVAEIVGEMENGFDQSWWDIDREWAHDLAGRIEAAHNREVAELQRRLKVAEDALEKCKDGMCGECSRQHPEGICVSPNGCYEMAAVRNALDVISGEGGANVLEGM